VTRPIALGAFVVALAAAGCSNSPTSPTTTPATSTTSPTKETFSSQLSAGGRATRSFNVPSVGNVLVTLTSTTPSGVRVGLGVGIPNATGAGCNMSISVVTTEGASPQITIRADSGAYCVQVYDVGEVTGQMPFSLSVEHP
jgi:hypothetical protein